MLERVWRKWNPLSLLGISNDTTTMEEHMVEAYGDSLIN